MPAQAQQANPLFGRPVWSYVNVIRGPVRGPQPKLARGSGHTGNIAQAGYASSLPGYVSTPDYKPSLFDYQQVRRDSFLNRIPRTILMGENGRALVGTYQPHDFTPAQRFYHQFRSSGAWQEMAFPPNYRQLLQRQQAQNYRVNSITQSARILNQSNYFLGYQVDTQVAQKIGGSTLGYMGSQ
jgi:hypothetical protein